MATAAEINTAISDSGKAGIKSVTSDGVTVTAMSIDEQIKASNHSSANELASKKHRGLGFTKLVPPAATS